jgi:hypothetical protein
MNGTWRSKNLTMNEVGLPFLGCWASARLRLQIFQSETEDSLDSRSNQTDTLSPSQIEEVAETTQEPNA